MSEPEFYDEVIAAVPSVFAGVGDAVVAHFVQAVIGKMFYPPETTRETVIWCAGDAISQVYFEALLVSPGDMTWHHRNAVAIGRAMVPRKTQFAARAALACQAYWYACDFSPEQFWWRDQDFLTTSNYNGDRVVANPETGALFEGGTTYSTRHVDAFGQMHEWNFGVIGDPVEFLEI